MSGRQSKQAKPGSLRSPRAMTSFHSMLRRTELVNQVLSHDAQVKLLIAGPGYGATTLMRQCAERWSNTASVEWVDSILEEGTETLSLAISRCGPSHLLCVDAPDGLARDQIKELAAVLLRASPPHLIIATHDPILVDQLPSRYALFDSAMLRFSDDETAKLLESYEGLALDAINSAEGWPLALDLMRKAMDDPALNGMPYPIKDVPQIEQFFDDVVWPKLHPEAARLLSVAAFLDANFSIDLLIWLSEDPEAWRKIEPAVTAQLFVYRVSDRSNIYRIHPLFAAFLRNPVRLPQDVDRDVVLERACDWFRRERRWDRAIHYAALREDGATIVEIAKQAGGWIMLGGGGLQSVGEALDALPELGSHPDPDVRALVIVSALKAGRNCQHLPETKVPLVQVIVDFYQDHLRGKSGLNHLCRARDTIGSSDPVAYAVLSSMICLTHLDQGALTACDGEAQRAVDLLFEAGHPGGTAYLQTTRARAATLRGDLDDADAHISRVFALGWEPMVEVEPIMQLASVQAATIALERGDTGRARRLMAQGWPFLSSSDGWYDVVAEAIGTSVRLALSDGNPAEALRAVAHGEAIAHNRGLPRLQLAAAAWKVVATVGSRDSASIDAAWRTLEASTTTADLKCDDSHFFCEAFAFAEASLALWRGDPDRARDRMVREAERAESIGARPLRRRALLWAAAAAYAARQSAMAETLVRAGLDGIADTKMLRAAMPFADSLVPLLGDMLRCNVLSEAHAALVRPIIDAGVVPAASEWLTAREEEILDLVGAGLANKEIARRLDISENTVKFHRKNIYCKLGVNRRSRALELLNDHRLQRTAGSNTPIA